MNKQRVEIEEVSATKETFWPMYEYLACYVSIWNDSSWPLYDAEVVAKWGKYPTGKRPRTNLEGGAHEKFVMMGRASAMAGCEGSVKYTVGSGLGIGSVKFYYTCPLSGDNQAFPTNLAPDIKVSVYGTIAADYDWDTKPWPREGQVPIDGHPLSALFVLEDKPEGG